MSKIVCIGSASKDVFFPTGDGVFVETPEDITAQRKVSFEVGAKYQVEDRFEAVGGVAANCAQGLSRLGFQTFVYSCLGDDQTGQWVLEQLKEESVVTDLVEKKSGAQTDLSAILVFTQNGERTIFFNRDANELLRVEAEKLVGFDWIFVSALNGDWKNNLRTVLQTAKNKNIRLAVNPGQRNMKDDAAVVLEAVAAADILLVNKDEAIELALGIGGSEEKDLQNEATLLEILHSYGAKTIALTDGLRGAWGFDGEQMLFVSVIKQTAVDATGSGDAFGSGFLAAYMQGLGLERALQWGIVNGGNVVRFYGAREGLLHTNEIENLANQASVRKA